MANLADLKPDVTRVRMTTAAWQNVGRVGTVQRVYGGATPHVSVLWDANGQQALQLHVGIAPEALEIIGEADNG